MMTSQPARKWMTNRNTKTKAVSMRHADRVGGEELAHELVLADTVCVFPGRRGPCRQRRVQHLFEQKVRNPEIRLAPRIVDQRRTRRLQQKIEKDRDRDADGQHPKRGNRLVRQYPVVDVHDEKRRRQRDQVYEDTPPTRPRHRIARTAPTCPSANAACRSSRPIRRPFPRPHSCRSARTRQSW